VEGEELHVVDDQPVPTGYEVVAHGAQSGNLGAIYDGVADGSVEIDNRSGLAYSPKWT